jgi:hypothetical protein
MLELPHFSLVPPLTIIKKIRMQKILINSVSRLFNPWFYIFLFCFVPQVAHSENYDELIGIYSISSPSSNESVDIIKIEKRGSLYFISSKVGRGGSEWPEPEQARIIQMNKFRDSLAKAELMGVDLNFGSQAFGLETDRNVILKLAKGWHSGKFKTDTGFLWYSIVGALEISRRPLPTQ